MKKMTHEELSKLTDEELLAMAKKLKSSSMMSALLIGVMVGVIIYSAVKNTWGFFTLVPLFFIYKMLEGSKKNDDLKKVLKERNLS